MAAYFASWPIWGLIGFVLAFFVLERVKPNWINNLEEGIVSIILVLITLVSFSQVIARYAFASGWTGALEFTRIMFAWLILFGASYVLKINSHLGVDAFIRMFPPRLFKFAALFGAAACVAYGIILLASDWLQWLGANARGGAIDYWSKMFKVGIGLDELAYPQWMAEALGLRSDRVHRWVAYLMLPMGLGLFTYRAIQAFVAIWRGERELIIAGHEAEELVAENQDALKE